MNNTTSSSQSQANGLGGHVWQLMQTAIGSPVLGWVITIESFFGLLLSVINVSVSVREKIWLHANRNTYVINLFISNAWASIIFIVFAIDMITGVRASTCTFFFTMIQSAFIATWSCLMLQMGDQYIAIEWPLKYPVWVTMRVTKVLIALSWILPIINYLVFQMFFKGLSLCTVTLTDDSIESFAAYILTAVAGIPIPLAVGLNMRILFIARKRANDVALIHVRPLSGSSNPKDRLQRSVHGFGQIWKSIFTATIVVGSMVITVCPFSLTMFFLVFYPPLTLEGTLKIFSLMKWSLGALAFEFVACPIVCSLRVLEIKKFYRTQFISLGKIVTCKRD